MTGTVFSVEEFSVYDGTGIRTTVFFKGCPLRCTWCHNPEGQLSSAEIVKNPNGCIHCGACADFAEKVDGRTVFNECSVSHCPMGLFRVCGREYDADELCAKILKNEKILKIGGGVTFSGGEPLLRKEFLSECLSRLKGRLHTAVQTSGFCNEADFKKIAHDADYFLFDLKLIDEAEHIRHTGVSNKRILRNFAYLNEIQKDFVVRMPLIPGITDTERNVEDTANLLKIVGIGYVELLPYNKAAGGKYALVGRTYSPNFNETAEPNCRAEIWEKFGIEIKVL